MYMIEKMLMSVIWILVILTHHATTQLVLMNVNVMKARDFIFLFRITESIEPQSANAIICINLC